MNDPYGSPSSKTHIFLITLLLTYWATLVGCCQGLGLQCRRAGQKWIRITGYPRSSWTKLNSYFRQKTCSNFWLHPISNCKRYWHLIFYQKNSEKYLATTSKSVSKPDFLFWNYPFYLVLYSVCYDFDRYFESVARNFSKFFW